MPLHCTAIGKALLAFSADEVFTDRIVAGLHRVTSRTITAPGMLRRQLERVVESGLAFEYEESATGIVCVAATVLDPSGQAVAAVSVTGPVSRFRPEAHGTAVRAAADGIAATLARRDVLYPREG